MHFEKTDSGEMMVHPGDDLDFLLDDEGERQHVLKVTDAEWSDVNEKQQRNLDQWCFAEYLEPGVFLQVLQQARRSHPVLDSYYHKRDNTLLLVLHNPMSPQLQSHVHWQTKVFSDVGFR